MRHRRIVENASSISNNMPSEHNDDFELVFDNNINIQNNVPQVANNAELPAS